MPLGAANLNLLGKYFAPAAPATRTAIDITAVNDTQVDTAVSKFGGGSMLMDGTGDYAYISGGTVDLSGDFTIEFWIYYNSLQNANILDWRGIHSTHAGGGTGIFALGDTLLIANNAGDFKCWIDGADRSTSGVIFSTGTWHHIAVQRQSGTINAWVNGTRYVDYAGSDDYSSVLAANQPIGANSSTSSQVSYLDGAIDEFRISTVARYTNGASITVPTTAFVNDSDTYLLHHMEGTDGSTTFEDDTGSREFVGVSAINDAQVDTAQSQFGGASALFDGTGDYLRIDDTSNLAFGSGDWTLECWARFDTLVGNSVIIDSRPSGGSAGPYPTIYCSGTTLYYFVGGLNFINGGTVSTNTWYHIAVVRSSGTVTLYLDGVSKGSATHTATYTVGDPVTIGASSYSLGNGELDGYIDEVRFSNTARYTTGFTPPTSAFTNDANTLLLLHMDGTDASTYFPDDNS